MFLTPREAAELLGLPVRRLADYRRRRKGPPYHKFGRQVRYHLQDLVEWAETHGDSLGSEQKSDTERSEER